LEDRPIVAGEMAPASLITPTPPFVGHEPAVSQSLKRVMRPLLMMD
jgi:hypothetical protein